DYLVHKVLRINHATAPGSEDHHGRGDALHHNNEPRLNDEERVQREINDIVLKKVNEDESS
ncbi:unnamed protein product, partial [Amoebophrya sp. A120]